MRIRSLVVAATFALGALPFASVTQAQSTTGSQSGYWAGSGSWKSGSGMCWRAGFWAPSMATSECDPDLVPKPPPPPPVAPRAAPPPPAAPAPAPAPVAKPAPPKPVVLTVPMLALFAGNSAVLDADAKGRLDRQIVAPINNLGRLDFVHIEGHTDRLGSAQANQKLSERRADAVAAYLVSKGLPKDKVETLGMGKTNQAKACPDQKDRKALGQCLADNRRVIVEIRGMPK